MILAKGILRVTAAILAAVILTPHLADASGLDTAILEMFPKDVAQLSYLDLKAARQQPWFAVAEQYLLPLRFRKLEIFLSAAGLDVETQVDTPAWGTVSATKTTGGGFVGVAAGHFSPGTVGNYFSQHNLPIDDQQGEQLFNIGGTTGDLFLVFVDSETAAFGQRAALENLLAVRSQGTESLAHNAALHALIEEVRQDSLTWSVWNKEYARAAFNNYSLRECKFRKPPCYSITFSPWSSMSLLKMSFQRAQRSFVRLPPKPLCLRLCCRQALPFESMTPRNPDRNLPICSPRFA
jgi:hypothetical protein